MACPVLQTVQQDMASRVLTKHLPHFEHSQYLGRLCAPLAVGKNTAMNRRNFLQASAAATALAGLSQAAEAAVPEAAPEAAPKAAQQEYYELRLYLFKAGAETRRLDDFLRQAAIPAWNRLGSQPIGAFTPREAGESPALYVLIPHPSLEAFASAGERLQADAEYQKAGAEYLNLPSSDPAFARFESSLMRAFAQMPRLELPSFSAEKKPRLFELRTYESHSERAALKKIEMFNAGEIDIMRRVGLGPVFYGQMLIGARLPNLTYMLSAEDMASHKKHWGAFGGDAQWKKISKMPGYADSEIVSKISSKFLVPTEYSQI